MLHEVDPTASGIRRRPACAICHERKSDGEVAVFAESRRQRGTWTTVAEVHRSGCCSACGGKIRQVLMRIAGEGATGGYLNLDECDFCRGELVSESWVIEAHGSALGRDQQFRVCVPCGEESAVAVHSEIGVVGNHNARAS